MARHYSTKHFFRQMPRELLARYFHGRGLLKDFDFCAMKEGNAEPLFAAWLEVPEMQRRPIDAEFQDIFEMCCEKGFRAIIDEARWQMREDSGALAEFIGTLSGLPNHYHRAMVTFLDHAHCWKGATLYYHADSLAYWRKRKHMGHRPAAVDDRSLGRLAARIGQYFHDSEGRGRNCVVEPLRRGELDYFFAYPEDYSQQSIEWVNGEFGRRPHNPAFEVIYVYSQREGTLDLNFRGTYTATEPLQGIFASAILGLDQIPPDPKDGRVYDLNPLRSRDFPFICPVGSGIESVYVKALRLSSRINQGDRITLEANPKTDPKGVYDLLDQVGRSVSLHLYHITLVDLAVSMVVDATKPPKTVSVRVSHPSSCSLKYDERDLRLRQMLTDSGIERKDPGEIPELAQP